MGAAFSGVVARHGLAGVGLPGRPAPGRQACADQALTHHLLSETEKETAPRGTRWSVSGRSVSTLIAAANAGHAQLTAVFPYGERIKRAHCVLRLLSGRTAGIGCRVGSPIPVTHQCPVLAQSGLSISFSECLHSLNGRRKTDLAESISKTASYFKAFFLNRQDSDPARIQSRSDEPAPHS